jgi:hypothetical protein
MIKILTGRTFVTLAIPAAAYVLVVLIVCITFRADAQHARHVLTVAVAAVPVAAATVEIARILAYLFVSWRTARVIAAAVNGLERGLATSVPAGSPGRADPSRDAVLAELAGLRCDVRRLVIGIEAVEL